MAQFYQYDAYGQLLGIWNGSGTLLSGGADGELASASLALTSTLYSGEQFDARIGQQYLRARYYDPATGRFNRLDPFFGNQTDPQSFHKYLYTHADPVNLWDPSGEFGIAGVGVGIALGAGFLLLANPNVANAPAPGDAVIPGQGDALVAAIPGEFLGGPIFRFIGKVAVPLLQTGAKSAGGWILTSIARELRRSKLAHVTYGSLDDLGRPTGVSAYLTREALDAGTDAASRIRPPGFVSGGPGGAGHARGHLLARILGGSGDIPENLATLFQNPVNTPLMSSIEKRV